MLSDLEIITVEFPERPDIRVYPIADVHLGAAEHMEQEWIAFCRRILTEENSYLILGGDLMNNATRNSVSDIFAETVRPRFQKKQLVKLLAPIRDKILCIVSGNHERRSVKDADDDPSYDIACKLDVEDRFRENVAFLRLRFGQKDGAGDRNPTYCFAVTHGAGGGALTGGAVNRGERFASVIDGIDGLIVGHTHKPFITNPSKIVVDHQNNRVSIKPYKVISCASWLNWGGYAARQMLPPTSFTPQIITLRGRKKEIRVEM